MSNIKINFFTCCNGIYKNFIPIFILSNIYHNKNSFVEVGVDNLNDADINIQLNYLNKLYPNRFSVYKIDFGFKMLNGVKYECKPNTVRFVTTPTKKTDYVYISDVDIICLEHDIMEKHISHIEKEKLPFSNIVRPYTQTQKYKKLTGLHFTPYSNYYPIPDYNDLIKNGVFGGNDEDFLYLLVSKKHKKINETVRWRPVHGIHVSPNRKPNVGLDWGMGPWKKSWIEFRETEEFLGLEKLFTSYIKDKIQIIDNFYGYNNI